MRYGRRVSFDVPADAYDQFMGRFSGPLAEQFAGWLPLAPGRRVLDVGCGPGALTAVLAARTGADHVSAVDPSASFAAAVRARVPGAEVRTGSAEALPWPDHVFDVSAAQLVVHLMADAPAGLAEMARVTRPGGTVAASVWDFAGGAAPASVIWRAAAQIGDHILDEAGQPGAREGHLAALLGQAGLTGAESAGQTVSLRFGSFAQWWDPFTLGVGPPGAYVASLDGPRRAALREACVRLLPSGPFTMTVRAWAARGTRP